MNITKIIGIPLFFFLSVGFAFKNSCVDAAPTNNPGFCASMKASAECHCMSTGLPQAFCNNMKSLHSRMVSMFGSLERACKIQHDTPVQNCIDDWNCYLNGGKNSLGQLCSSTGQACE